MDLSAMNGLNLTGTVKSYSRTKMFGFITCEKIPSDIFFWHKQLSYAIDQEIQWNDNFWIKGQEVEFEMEVNEEGKPVANKIKVQNCDVENGGGKGKSGYSATKGGGKGKGAGKKGDGYGKGGKGKAGKGKAPMDEWGGYGYAPQGYDEWGGAYDAGWGNEYDQSWGGYRTQETYGKGGKPRPRAPRPPKEDGGVPVCDYRIYGTMKNFSSESKWGFANCDPSVGDYGDIFCHVNNLDPTIARTINALRVGEAVEFRLEDVAGKMVAKAITIVPQEPSNFAGQWMRGIITSYNASGGIISSPRLQGDIGFTSIDTPPSVAANPTDREVIFYLVATQPGAPVAQLVIPLYEIEYWEQKEWSGYIVERLQSEGFLDETAAATLVETDPLTFVNLLPDLEYYSAENPSSYIIGALNRGKKGLKGKGKAKGAPKGEESKGKGGKGKERYGPYY